MHRGDVARSKRLALILRHRPGSVGIRLDAHGWADVGELLAALAGHGSPMSREQLDRVVRGNDKQRFEWDAGSDRIRARQGHSIDVDPGLLPATPPAVLYHGTTSRAVLSILETGLDRRGRHHVHLSADLDTARRVGARRGAHVVLAVESGAMAEDGFEFLRSSNGVWLTDRVPPRYLARHG